MSSLILDTSAIVAFAAGSVDVGEPIAEVHTDGGRVIVPLICLIEATRLVGDEMPQMLVKHPACVVPPVTVELWPALTSASRVLGRLDLAAAYVAASSVRGYILTGEPEAYHDLGDDFVIPI